MNSKMKPVRYILAIGFVVTWSVAVSGQGPLESHNPISVELVDEIGQPVDGAEVGLMAMMGPRQPVVDRKYATEWTYGSHTRSDARGVAIINDLERRHMSVCLIARHEQRGISAIAHIDQTTLNSPAKLTLVPECELCVKAKCDEFAKLKRPLGPIVIEVAMAEKGALVCYPDASSCSLKLPPGDYRLTVYGGGYPDWSTSTATHHVHRKIQVSREQTPQTLDVIDLPATKLALLEGLPAPELTGVTDWKNGEPTTLHDLRGRYVLLDFWGYWCPPCVERMPKLFALHDKLHAKGLTVIGIHVDLGEDEAERVDRVAALDQRLAKTRTDVWSGRDIPFLVALTRGERTDFGNGADRQALSKLAAEYGILSYPTCVLIDRRGNVVQKLAINDEGLRVLEKALDNR